MTITMALVEATLEDEIAKGCTQADAASTYAWAIRNMNLGQPVDWPRMNRAIAARWPKGLARVKEAAHRWYRKQFNAEPIA